MNTSLASKMFHHFLKSLGDFLNYYFLLAVLYKKWHLFLDRGTCWNLAGNLLSLNTHFTATKEFSFPGP